MKKLIAFLAIVMMSVNVFAQSPEKMSYQCVVRNASGGLVANKSVGIRISILQSTPTGPVVYKETYTPNPQTNANGLLSIEIGGGSATTGTFTSINWANGIYFLKTETDPTGGTNYTIVGTSQLLSVPYALYAKTAGNGFSGNYNDLTNLPVLFGGNYNDLINKPVLFDGTWVNILGKPTTLAGFGITDAVSTLGDQTIAGIKTFTETINVSSQNITNVANPVNTQDAATKAYVDALQTQITMLKNTLKAGGIVTDTDGNPYNTVVIGMQTWMAENLKTTKFNNGDPIPAIIDITAWVNLTTSGYCWFHNDEATFKNLYGALYNWYSVNTGNLCPTGWHVPTRNDWAILSSYLGGEIIAGGKMKETGTTHWSSPNTGADNSSGFTALPGGSRDNYGIFCTEGSPGYWWNATERGGTNYAWAASISNFSGNFSNGNSYIKTWGFSVRCLKN